MWYPSLAARDNNAFMRGARVSSVALFGSFGIWVVYGTLAGMRHWSAAVVFGLLASTGLLSLTASFHVKVKLLDWVLLAYFVIAALATFAARAAVFPIYSSVVIWVLYACVTWISILVGAPFTVQYARESVPPEHWSSPDFVQSNRIISTVWGVAFVVNIVLVSIALKPPCNPLLIGVLAPLLMMGASAVFTWRYKKILHERARSATA